MLAGTDTATITREVRSQEGGERVREASAGFAFEALLKQFLNHLSTSRRYSPRTAAAYAGDCRKVARALTELGCSLDVREITTADLQVCLGMFPTLSATSLQRLGYALRSFFSYLARIGVVPRNPTDHLELPRREHRVPRAVAEEDVHALLGACRDVREKIALVLLSHCGLRRGEMLALAVQDVAGDLAAIKVEGKGKRQRIVPVHESLRPLLQAQIASLPPGATWLIPNQAGTQMSPTSFHRMFRRIALAAGLEAKALSPHALRHHFARSLLRSGADLATISELMGHSSVATTAIYLRSDAQSKRDAIARLPPPPVSALADTPPAGCTGRFAGRLIAERGDDGDDQ